MIKHKCEGCGRTFEDDDLDLEDGKYICRDCESDGWEVWED